jgi:hypothetical protein
MPSAEDSFVRHARRIRQDRPYQALQLTEVGVRQAAYVLVQHRFAWAEEMKGERLAVARPFFLTKDLDQPDFHGATSRTGFRELEGLPHQRLEGAGG